MKRKHKFYLGPEYKPREEEYSVFSKTFVAWLCILVWIAACFAILTERKSPPDPDYYDNNH